MPELAQCDVFVIGGSIPGAVVALECAKLGLKVTVLGELPASLPDVIEDSADGLGWLIDALISDGQLDSSFQLVPEEPETQWVFSHTGLVQPVPAASILGIPSSPLSREVSDVVGTRAALRAYLDRLKPVLTIGKAHHLGELVAQRMGENIRDLLVSPLVMQRFGASPDQLDVAVAVPGLNEAITRTGSLSTGVLASLSADAKRQQRYRLAAHGEPLIRAIRDALAYWDVTVLPDDTAEKHTEGLISHSRVTVLAGEPRDACVLLPPELTATVMLAVRDVADYRMSLPNSVERNMLVRPGLVSIGSIDSGQRVSFSLRQITDDGVDVRVQSERAMVPMAELGQAQRRLQDGDVPRRVREFIGRTAGSDFVETESLGDPFLTHYDREFAPWLTLDETHAFTGIRSQLNELDGLRCVGSWLHAGKLSAAIDHAHDVALSVRRELLGLS